MRLFVGIALPDSARAAIATLQAGLPGARWIDPDIIHLTLRFIGEVDGAAAEDIDTVLAAVRAPAFELSLAGVGVFESGGEVHTVWVDVPRSAPLVFLRNKIESAIVRAGLEPERRKFKPHVTLARLRETPSARVGAWLRRHNGFAVAPFAAESFSLVRSYLGRDGAHYEDLATYPLDGLATIAGNDAI